MPIAYEIDAQADLVRTRVWGRLTLDEVSEHFRRITSDPAFDATYSELVDIRELTDLAIPTSAIQSTADVKHFGSGARRAIVATTDLQYGMARMFATFAQDVEQDVQVFRELADAREWLGI